MKTGTKLNTDTLQDKIKGTIILPDHSAYDDARRIWNAMIDRRPALIVRCAEAADVPPAIAFALEHNLEISIRGGGHHIGGHSVCDGGLVIDFSEMKKVRVDPATRRAYVQPGATLRDFDQAVQIHGLAPPVGICCASPWCGLSSLK